MLSNCKRIGKADLHYAIQDSCQISLNFISSHLVPSKVLTWLYLCSFTSTFLIPSIVGGWWLNLFSSTLSTKSLGCRIFLNTRSTMFLYNCCLASCGFSSFLSLIRLPARIWFPSKIVVHAWMASASVHWRSHPILFLCEGIYPYYALLDLSLCVWDGNYLFLFPLIFCLSSKLCLPSLFFIPCDS